MDIVPVAELNFPADEMMKELSGRLRMAGFGVTVQGSHLTLRWNHASLLRSMTLVVDGADDGRPDDQIENK